MFQMLWMFSQVSKVFRRLRHMFEYLFRRRRLEDDLDEELRSSLELLVDRYVARGMPYEEARRAAHWLGSLLYGVSAGDAVSYALALILLPAAALLGCWRPAWRAASANPAETIRQE